LEGLLVLPTSFQEPFNNLLIYSNSRAKPLPKREIALP
jgi:hypothetical protein